MENVDVALLKLYRTRMIVVWDAGASFIYAALHWQYSPLAAAFGPSDQRFFGIAQRPLSQHFFLLNFSQPCGSVPKVDSFFIRQKRIIQE
jgi:hypothetical protein